MLRKLDLHQGFVKGVCWDPVGQFLATQVCNVPCCLKFFNEHDPNVRNCSRTINRLRYGALVTGLLRLVLPSHSKAPLVPRSFVVLGPKLFLMSLALSLILFLIIFDQLVTRRRSYYCLQCYEQQRLCFRGRCHFAIILDFYNITCGS